MKHAGKIVSNLGFGSLRPVKRFRRALANRIRSLAYWLTRRHVSEFDALVATVAPRYEWPDENEETREAPRTVGLGDGWAVWRRMRKRRPGVAGIHVVLADLTSQLEEFLAELDEQCVTELGQPNRGHYRFAGDITHRNSQHARTVEAARVQVEAAMNRLRQAETLLTDRWSTWPAPMELER